MNDHLDYLAEKAALDAEGDHPVRPATPKGLQPLPARDFFALKPGDKFVVYWAKDDDPANVRLNFEEQTVDAVERDSTGGAIIFPTDEGYEWSTDEMCSPGESCLDTSRGYAYLYRRAP